MKYLFKAISTNTKDMRTGILVTIDDVQYLFNTPDGLQRIAVANKVPFNKIRYVFVSNLKPDYFAGFPGLYMSARESS